MSQPLYKAKLLENVSSFSRSGVTASVTVQAGSDRVLVAIVSLHNAFDPGGTTVSSIVFNGSENFVRRANNNNNPFLGLSRIEIWTLDDPTVTTANLVVTYSGNVEADAVRVHEYTGAADGIGATGNGTGNTSSISVAITTASADSLIVGGVTIAGGDTDPFTPGAGATERADGATGASTTRDTGYWDGEIGAAAAGAHTLSATASASDLWAGVAIELKTANPNIVDFGSAAVTVEGQAVELENIPVLFVDFGAGIVTVEGQPVEFDTELWQAAGTATTTWTAVPKASTSWTPV